MATNNAMNALETRIDRLEEQATKSREASEAQTTKVGALEAKVTELKNLAWVLGAVAGALGIGGASLWTKLSVESDKVAQMGKDIDARKKSLEDAVAAGKTQLQQATDQQIQRLTVAVGVPPLAILAFKSNTCPQGWQEYRRGSGRVVLGAGQIPDGPDVTAESQGGRSHVTLGVANLPPHKHDTLVAPDPNHAAWGPGPERMSVLGNDTKRHITGLTSPGDGQSQPFEVLPPFVALRLCERM